MVILWSRSIVLTSKNGVEGFKASAWEDGKPDHTTQTDQLSE